MLSCKEVARKIASYEFSEADWRERIMVRLHLLICRHCRRYTAQLRAVGAAAQNLWRQDSEDSSTLARLEGDILERWLGEVADSEGSSKSKIDNVDPQ